MMLCGCGVNAGVAHVWWLVKLRNPENSVIFEGIRGTIGAIERYTNPKLL